MRTEIFNKLMANTKLDTDNDLEVVGFSGKYGSYEISFYGCMEDSYKIVVEDFGCLREKEWEIQEPTEKQIQAMQKMMDDKVKKIEKTSEDERRIEVKAEDFDGDYYRYYGVSEAMFI